MAEISLIQRIMSFLKLFENDCRACMRRHLCADCRNAEAKNLIQMMNNRTPPKPVEDISIGARVKKVLDLMSQSGKPMTSKEINLGENVSKTLKEWTLNSMLKNGTIRRKKKSKHCYEYYISPFYSRKLQKGCNKK